MPRRSRARRTRARRAHRSHASRQRRRRMHRHHRRNIIRSRGTTGAVTGSRHAAGVPLGQKRTCMVMSLVTGVVLVTVGLTVTFEVSVSAGIAPISLGILSCTAGFILCITHLLNRPVNRTVELTPTPAPENIPTAPPGFGVPSGNTYPDQAPLYTATMGLPGTVEMQYGGFGPPTTMNQEPPPPGNMRMQYDAFAPPMTMNYEPPPPSYAEATTKTSS